MPLVYRVMTKAADGKPEVGRSAKCLGVRVPRDIQPDANGVVHPGTGGMSVSPTLFDLPALLVPRHLRHLVPGAAATGRDLRVWKFGSGNFEEAEIAPGLILRPDGPDHGTIQPLQAMPLAVYEEALAATREQWLIDETGA